ncbi:MAG: hypothetical protein DSZ27_07275 [Thiomicrospira sp.]|nr:MAG: hypothetical protein DSZ27_07275 [Thiomicrospira sp.]
MAEYIGNKGTVYTGTIAATNFFPELKVSDFQELFAFLNDENENSILLKMTVSKANIDRQLLDALAENYTDLIAVSQALWGNDLTADAMYKQAVFSRTASDLIDNRLSTDATKEASDRQSALDDRVTNLRTQATDALDQLLSATGETTGYTFELL